MIPSAFMFLPALPLTENGKVSRRDLPSPTPRRRACARPSSRAARWRTSSPASSPRCCACRASGSARAMGSSISAATRSWRRRPSRASAPPSGSRCRSPRSSKTRPSPSSPRGSGPRSRPPSIRGRAAAADPAHPARRAAPDVLRARAPLVPGPARSRGRLVHRALHDPLRGRARRRGPALCAPRDRAPARGAADDVRHRGRPPRAGHPPRGRPTLPILDLGALPDAEREPAVRRELAEETRRPFDLTEGPLLRTRLLRLGAEDHVLLFITHHIVADAWTRGVLHRELAALYTAFAAGRPSPLAELAVQYADYALWQRRWLEGNVLDAQLAYWKKRLAGAPPSIDLPTDRPRPAVRTNRGERRVVTFSPELTRAVKGSRSAPASRSS